LNPPHACLAIFQSRALCSKVDPSCCQLKADVDAGPHLLSSGPSATRRWIPPRVHSSRPERSRLDLMGGRRRGAGGGPRRSHGLLDGCVIRWASSTTPATPTRGVSNGPC
jgi:hypothetical protein